MFYTPIPYIGETISKITHKDSDICGWKCERTLQKLANDKNYTTIAISWNDGERRISHEQFIDTVFVC